VGIIAAVLAMSLVGPVLANRRWNDELRLVGAGRFFPYRLQILSNQSS
jgi:hypothetical protein